MSNTKTSRTLAQKIKKARKEAGFSQKELANLLKLSDKAVSSYEVGRALPGLPTLKELSKITYKPITYFMNDGETTEETIQCKIQFIEKELAEIKALLKKKKT